MSDKQLACNDTALEVMLRHDQSLEPSEELLAHLENCPRCQHRISELAGSNEEWQAAKAAVSGAAGTIPRYSPPPVSLEHSPLHWTESMAKQLLSPPSHPEMLGRLGRYEVERLIGAGGMGIVFKAFDTELNRPVAIKLLAPYLASCGPARKRFSREARAAAAVVHQHVVPIHNVETERESPFIVMQYVSGESLQSRIDREGSLELCEILRIGMQVADGLSAAHQQGLVHRDIKPSNILLEEDVDRALISDFGLARAADDASLTRSGFHPGTPQYMSPEQASGNSVDARSDLFSLGSTLYTMCTGRPPFRAESSLSVMRRITDSEPMPIREINPRIPEWLERLVSMLLAKRVDDRPQSATVVASLLQQCLAHLEQPHSVSLPKELLNSKVTLARRTRRNIIMLISATTITTILGWTGIGLLIHEPAQTSSAMPAAQTSEQDQATEGTRGAPPKMKGSTTVSGYKITLEGVGNLGDITERVTRFRPKLNTSVNAQGSSNFTSDQFATGQTFNNGNGTGGAVGGFGSASAGGGGGGFTGGGAGFGHSFVKPTYGIALKITEEGVKGKRENNRYAQLGTAVKIVEIDGTVEEAKDSGPITSSWPKFDNQFPGAAGLYVPRRQRLDVPIKEIHGELKITTGRRLEAIFAGARPHKKKVDGEEFAIKSINETPEGLTVVVSFPPTSAMKKAGNIFERVQLMMASMSNYELEIEDKEGNVYIPSGASATGSGGGSTQNFSFNGNNQKRSSQSSEPELSTLAFQFKPIQSYSIKSITARIVEADGEPETVRFMIEVQSE
ncbi:serine/threonine-protein kinase [Pirellulaceae bacterium SH449]